MVKITRQRLKTFLQQAQKEIKQYESVHQTIYLAQAGEKLWNAFNIIIALKSKEKIRSHKDLREAVAKLYAKTGQRVFIEGYESAYELHKFFYRGWTSDIDDIYNKCLYVYSLIKVIDGMEVR